MYVFILVWMKESKACEWRRWMLPPPRPSNKSTRLFWLCTNRHWWRPTWVTAQIVRGFTEKPRPFAWQLHVDTHKWLLQDYHWLRMIWMSQETMGTAKRGLASSSFPHSPIVQCLCKCTYQAHTWPVRMLKNWKHDLNSLLSLVFVSNSLLPLLP